MGLCSKIIELTILSCCFICAAVVLGVYSYFLAVLADRSLPINNQWKAVEGISGAACLWALLQVPLMCCCGGKKFVAVLLAGLNGVFCAAFIALAVLTRDGADSCSGNVNTPIGSGPADSDAAGFGADGFGFGDNANSTYAPDLHLACRLNTAAFAVSLIGALFFLLAAVMNIVIGRHKRAESKYGPSPKNNYGTGSGRRFMPGLGALTAWRTKKKGADYGNPDALPAHPDASLMQDEKKNDYGSNPYSSAGTYHTGGQPGYGQTAPATGYAAPYSATTPVTPGVSSHNAMLKSEAAPNPYSAV